MDSVHTETLNGLKINIIRDNDAESPDSWGDDNLFLVGYHRDFSVDGPRVYHKLPAGVKRDASDKGHLLVEKRDVIALLHGKKWARENDEAWPGELAAKYHVFPLEAYIHSGVRLALVSDAAPFPDRRWDVSVLGAVFVAKTEFKTRARCEKLARGHVDTWNDYLSGNVYGFQIEGPNDESIDSCWGFFGDYDAPGGALHEARDIVKARTRDGKTDARGQFLFPWAPELQPASAAA